MIYLVSIGVFTSLIMTLVFILLAVQAGIVRKGTGKIVINGDAKKSIAVPLGTTLLSALSDNDIFLPSACGGGGSCGQCRCRVISGGGAILPTELPHLCRADKKENIRLSCQLKVRDDLKIEVPPEIFSIKKYTGVVAGNKNIGTFIKELAVDLDPGQALEFSAGAYMQIDVPKYTASFSEFDICERFRAAWDRTHLFSLSAGTNEPVFRAYSLANPPADNHRMLFTIRIATPPENAPEAPPGVGSSYVFNLKPGDRVVASGPYGDFFVKQSDLEMCFVGGGAGMAPMRSHIRHQLLTVGTNRKITFWYGARDKKEMLYHDEFTALNDQFDNFDYHVALSKPDPKVPWDGMTGFVHKCLYENYLKNHPDPTGIEYYLCGPQPMIDTVNKMLYELGVELEMIAYDQF
ncbi:MAG: NADH:ubiquinone reductase (Na(+)-transporting) subunit F [Deltaproteobacteria bacterium]|nr:NADH:ubiquinone reductase (Na(+)-transporting) subunit F [Deltaproteobacteria bacterium]